MIELLFEKLSRYPRIGEPCSIAIPFAQGALTDPAKTLIVEGERPVPLQRKVTAIWPDGSVKWLLVHFLADLPGNQKKSFYFSIQEPLEVLPENPVFVTEAEGRMSIRTGTATIELSNAGEKGIFHRVEVGGYGFEKDEFKGPDIYSPEGKPWSVEVGRKGWKIIENGPVRAVVETEGKHRDSSGQAWIDYVLRLYTYAGKPWVQMEYQIINKENTSKVKIKGMEFRFEPVHGNSTAVNTALATSNYRSDIQKGVEGQKLDFLIDADYLLYDANEHIPETLYGTFWADWNSKDRGGVCATLYQAYQNFPKALTVDEKQLAVGILPKDGEGIDFLQGVAKTHRLLLHFHGPEATPEELNIRSLQFQMPDRPVVMPEVYKEAKVFENIFTENKIHRVERSLINLADARARAYGMLHWGDAPDMGYTLQGRGNGELVWTNNEYDFPHAAMLIYARTAERRMLDYMLVTAQHWMDVDICHYSEDALRIHGQVTHSAKHVTGEVTPCHEWVEGLLDFYHQTGEAFAYKAAVGIGENVVRLLGQPRYQGEGGINARETGWALRTLVALYKETHDEKWLEPAEKIVGHFEIWKKEYGGWLAPYTDHTTIRVPFMIAVAVNSLMRYYQVRPQERIKAMVVDAVRDLVENCMTENVFYYKELPSLRRLGNNTLILEALAYAYEFTGEAEFLKAGLTTFYSATSSNKGGAGGTKKKEGDAVVMLGAPGPKSFAQSFHALAYYYRAASDAGILKNESER